ncbi:hypothetical protein Tco_0479474 [Tanacetum coccineum]
MLKICPKLPGQEFDEPPLEEEILSFIRDLGHTGEIKFLSAVNVNHMHQPWRSFAAIISGKTTALKSLRLSRAQILWGMYHNKKVDYVYLLWEDLVFQVENKNSKKNNDMYYPRFTKVIVNYFMAKDQAIPRRNKMFWHYDRDDFMFTTIRVISKHQETQTKPTQASKGKRIKTSAKGDKAAKIKQSATKSKGLIVLSKVALSEADQLKLASKRSKKEFNSSHASSSGDGVDLQSKVPDEQQQTLSGTNEGAGDKPEVPDVPEYKSESEEESWTFSQGEDDEENDEHDNDQDEEKEEEKANDDDEVSSDQKVSTLPNYEFLDEKENQEDDDNVMGKEQEDEEDKELYGNLNLNLDRRDAEMTYAQTNQETEEVHVNLTTEPPVVQQQSSSVSSNLVSKLINPSLDTGIDSILNPNVQSDILVNVSVFATIETQTELSELKQTNQFAKALSSILGIVDNYLESKMKDAIDSNIKAIIKYQVKAQVSKIIPKVEKYVTESLGAEVLARSSNQPQTSYAAATSLSKFQLKKILIDKTEENKSMNKLDIQKNLYNTLIESYNLDKDLFASYGDVVTLKRGRDDQDKDEELSAGSNRGTKQRRSGKEESSKKATQKEFKSKSSSKGASRSQPKSSGKSVQAEEHAPRLMIWKNHCIKSSTQEMMMYRLIIAVASLKIMEFFGYKHLEEITVQRQDDQLYRFREGDFKRLHRQDIQNMLLLLVHGKLTNLNLDERFALNVDLRMYTRRIVIQEHVEDLQLAVESYQKKINLSRPDSYRSDLRKMTPDRAEFTP